MALAVIMKLVGSIDIPGNVGKRFSKECEAQRACAKKIFENTFEFAPVILIRMFDPSGEKSYRRLDITTNA